MKGFSDFYPKRADISVSDHEEEVIINDFSKLTNLQKNLIKYLEEKTEGKRLAKRADINPVDLKSSLPFITLLETTCDDNKQLCTVKIKLMGSGLTHFYGENTGVIIRRPEENETTEPFPEEIVERIFSSVTALITHRKPVRVYSKEYSKNLNFLQVCSIMIPLSENGTDITGIIDLTEITESDGLLGE